MPKKLVPVLAMVVLGIGCSDSGGRRAGQDIQSAIRDAQRRYDQALALMSGSPYKLDEQFAPLTQKRPVEKMKMQPLVPEVVNPNIVRVLDEARAELEKALSAGARNATAEDRELANAMLGRVAALKGQYYTIRTLAAQAKAWSALADADSALAQVRSQQGLMASLDQISAAKDEDVLGWLEEAKTEAAGLKAKVAQSEAMISDSNRQKAELQAKYNDLTIQGEKFRIDSRGAEGQARLDLFDKYQAKQNDANNVQGQIAALENKIQEAQTALKGVQLTLTSAETRVAVGEDILKNRAEQRQKSSGGQKDLASSLAQAKEQAIKQVAAASEQCRQARVSQEDAAKAYQLAAQRLADSGKQASSLCEQAAVMMAEGDLYARGLPLQAASQRTQETFASLMGQAGAATMPASVDLSSCFASASESRAKAEKMYAEAEKTYANAAQGLRGGKDDDKLKRAQESAHEALKQLGETPAPAAATSTAPAE